jgi:hypothetical protein
MADGAVAGEGGATAGVTTGALLSGVSDAGRGALVSAWSRAHVRIWAIRSSTSLRFSGFGSRSR